MGKRHKPEEIIGKLREAEIVLAQGGTTADACRRIAHFERRLIAERHITNLLDTSFAVSGVLSSRHVLTAETALMGM